MISGLVPCSFIDYPGRLSAVVFVRGCNLRCPYCHNPDLVTGRTHCEEPSDAVLELLARRRKTLSGVVVSGGEPTTWAELETFILNIKSMGHRVKLDTNGTHPQILARLIERRYVDYVALDLKDVPSNYAEWLGAAKLEHRIAGSIDVLQRSDVPHEYRTTLVAGRHDLETLLAMRDIIGDAASWYLQCAQSGHTLNPPAWSAIPPTEARVLASSLVARGALNVRLRNDTVHDAPTA